MFNYEYEMSMMLQRRLKPIVKGKIFVNVCDDILRVEITNPLGGGMVLSFRRFCTSFNNGNNKHQFVGDNNCQGIQKRYVKRLFRTGVLSGLEELRLSVNSVGSYSFIFNGGD